MAYTPTVYVNDNPPALNASNLNKMEQGIYDASVGVERLNYTGASYDLSETAGYIDTDGSIVPAGANKEKYTGKIPVSVGDLIGFRQMHDSAHSLWAVYALYDSGMNFISRTNLAYNVSAKYLEYDVQITNSSAAYIAFSYRTYDDAITVVFDESAKKALNEIGSLSSLNTTNKANIVGAINEVNSGIDGKISVVETKLNYAGIYKLVESSGYIDSDGTIRAAGATQEKYTNKIPVSSGDLIAFRQIHDASHSLWAVYALYDSNNTFISRNYLAYNVNTDYLEYNVEISDPTAAYISFSYKTYGDAITTIYDACAQKALNEIGSLSSLTTSEKSNVVGAINEINSGIGFVNDITIQNLPTHAGYLTSTGRIGAQDPSALEVYTDKMIVGANDKVEFDISFASTKTLWIAYGKYDLNGNWIERVVLYNENNTKYNGKITIPSGVGYVVFTWRTYGSDTTNIYHTPNVNNLAYERTVEDLQEQVDKIKFNGLNNPMFNPLKLGFTMHRGLSSAAPENTVPAFTLAGQGGAWGIETDVHESTDGVFYVFHDDTVDRMTDGTGNIAEMTSTQIDALNIDAGSHIEEYPGLKIPKLSEYLAICKKYGCIPVIELKNITNYDDLIDEVNSFGLEQACIYIAANETKIKKIRAEGCNTMCAWIRPINYDYDTALNTILQIENCTIDLEIPDTHLTYAAVKKFHDYNLPVMIYTCDSSADADTYASIGVDNITSNSIMKFT